MRSLIDLACTIDAASDERDENLLRQLGEDCENRLVDAESEERVKLLYFQANAFAGIIQAKSKDSSYTWSLAQPDGIRNLLLLRRAIAEPAFESIDAIVSCQIRTNLASRLNAFGRPVAANEEYLKVLETEPRFAKALANRASVLSFYARSIYDGGQVPHLLASARTLLDGALCEEALWESGDRGSFAPSLEQERESISSWLDKVGYEENFDLNQWSLGDSEKERRYRLWCLEERLFLNPLNEAYTDSAVAQDVLHLPSHTYRLHELPRFPGYYNLLKQEYVSARYRLYRATHQDDPPYIMRDVLMLEGGENQVRGHFTEDLRSAYRSAYSIFDKIGLFLNDYFGIGLKAKDVTFRKVWPGEKKSSDSNIRRTLEARSNYPLLGLYFLSKDLFEEEFVEVAQPDAAGMKQLRNQIEHRFLSLQCHSEGAGTEVHQLMTMEDFQDKVLRLLKLAREALVYLSLAMHREEASRAEATGSSG